MRVLLVNPPYIGWLNDIKVEPLGLLYIASFLRQHGHEVALYDPYIGEPESRFIDLVTYWKPSIVACAVYTVSEEFCFDLARKTKQLDPGITFIAGGPHASFAYERMLSRCREIDVITIKESEETVLRIITRLESGRAYTDVPGIAYYDANSRSLMSKVVKTEPYVAQLPIEAYPFPAKDLLGDLYYDQGQTGALPKNFRSSGLITARGCAYRCDFCVSPIFFKGVRKRRIEDVTREVEQCIEERQITHLHFYDDVFAYNLRRMQEVRELIGPLGLTWDCYIRIDCISYEMLAVMKEAGCIQVRFGVESGVEERRAAKKGGKTATFEKHRQVVEWSRELGIESLASYIIGFPDETKDDILLTIDFADRLDTDRVGFYKLTPYPGTRYWDLMEAANINYDTYTKLENEISLNNSLDSQQLFKLVERAYTTYYENRSIPYDDPDTLRFLTSLPKMSY